MFKKILLLIILCSIIILTILIIKIISNYIIKKSFLEQYKITNLPKSIKVRKNRDEHEKNWYYLKYPYWYISKKDGTADQRIKNNYIIWQKSELYIDNYLLFTKRPYALINTVKKLRVQGAKIDLCKEERKKYTDLLKKKKAFVHNSDIQKIIDYYSEKPTNFEGLCSEMFTSLGYICKLTPPTNDGGYDILLNKGGEKTIVECKCYSITHNVGRPSIQKLVGANSTILADNMIFITTSDFSASAILYAKESGVELINGRKLMELLDTQGFLERENVEVSIMECQLTISDLRSYVPKDIYEFFFI